MMGTFAAIGSPSMVGLSPDEVTYGGFSTKSTIQRSVEEAASAKMPLLLQSESSTGEEIPARFIHRQYQWADGAFVKVSCPAILATLLESELSGHGKGSFTKNHGTIAKWLEPLCVHFDESIGNLGWLDSVS
jgi:DNA-binding NtrC family response regulator